MPLVQFAKAIALLRRHEAVRYFLLWRKAILKEREHSLPVGLSTPSPLVFGKDWCRNPSATCLGKILRRGGPSLLRIDGSGHKPRARPHREQVEQEHSQPAVAVRSPDHPPRLHAGSLPAICCLSCLCGRKDKPIPLFERNRARAGGRSALEDGGGVRGASVAHTRCSFGIRRRCSRRPRTLRA
jgi:hypothetical protein